MKKKFSLRFLLYLFVIKMYINWIKEDFKRKKNTKILENSTVLYKHSLHDNIGTR